MFYNLINRSTAAFGGAPFRSNLCTALGSAGAGAGAGAAFRFASIAFLFLSIASCAIAQRSVLMSYAGSTPSFRSVYKIGAPSVIGSFDSTSRLHLSSIVSQSR